MILQVVAHGKVLSRGDAERRELVGWTDAGQQEQVRRVVRAAGDDHLTLRPQLPDLVALQDLHTDGVVTLDEDARREGVGQHLDVAALRCGMEIRDRGAATPPVALRDLEAADAVLVLSVVVRVRVETGFDGRLDTRIHERVHRATVGHRERPADPVVVALPALVVLRTAEVRQHVLVAPAGETHGGPLVVVGSVATDVDHRVERARAAEHAPTWHVGAAAGKPWLCLRDEVPVDAALQERTERERHVDLRVGVGGPGFDHRDPNVRILAQAGGEHAARRAGSDDHVVERHRRIL